MSVAEETNMESGVGKYRGLAASIVILVVLVVALLLLNLFLSNSIRTGGQTTAMIGRQSALINQVSKDLFLIESRIKQNIPVEEETANLSAAIAAFDDTLNAVSMGGSINIPEEMGVSQKTLEIEALETRESSLVLFEAEKIWSWYKESLDPLFANNASSQTELLNARDISEKYTQRLAFLMDIIAGQIQQKITTNLNYLRTAQIIGIALTAFMLVWTIFIVVRNLRKNDEELDRARQETNGILNTVREGLFLLDQNLVVSGQYSSEMEDILETDNIGGVLFTDLLENIISNKEMETVKEFVKLLFDPEKIEGLIESLNPLEKIQVNLLSQDSTPKTKYLAFSFYRVFRADQVVRVLVSVRDVSEQVLLEQQLEEAKKQGDEQVEMLVSFIHADPKVLNQFLAESRRSFHNINLILKEPISDKRDFKEKVTKMLTQIHRMKGEAASLNFDEFANKAHIFENDLTALKNVRDIKGMDFLPLVIQLDGLITYTDKLSHISRRMAISAGEQTFDQNDKATMADLASVWQHLPSTVEKIANEMGKNVQLVMTGLVESDLREEQRTFINHVGIQLIRNAIVHGIETPEERSFKAKPATGRIDFRISRLDDGQVEFVIRDDGRGLDLDKIREKTIASGIAPKSMVMNWSDTTLATMVFKTGFSTSKQANMHSGRGVGLDVVRDSIKKLNGKLRFSQLKDKYCQFEITLPTNLKAHAKGQQLQYESLSESA